MPLSDFYESMKGWTPAGSSPAASLPQLPTPEVQVSPFLRTSLPLPLIYTPDTLKQSNRPGLSSYRIAPQSPSSFPAINSAVTSSVTAAIAQAVIPISSGITSVRFTAPKEAVITGSPIVPLGGTINWAWASETNNTVFAAAGGTALDEVDNFATSIGNASPLTITTAPSRSSDLAILFTCQDQNATTGFNPGSPWSSNLFNTTQSVYSQILSGTNVVNATGSTGTPNGSWASILALFTSKPGFTPAILNHATITSGAFSSWTNAAISFSPTAGNTLIAFYMSGNTSFLGSPALITFFSDSQGNIWTVLGSVFISSGSGISGEQIIVLGAKNIVGGAITFSGTLSGLQSNGLLGVIEISNLASFVSVPAFRFLVPADIPPINLAKSNLNGGVIGTLPVASGGTGTTTATGGAGSVVLSNAPTLVTPVIFNGGSGTSSQFNAFANLYLRTDLLIGGVAAPWTNYTAAMGGGSTFPILAFGPAAGATGNIIDVFAPGSTTVKNFSLSSSGKISAYNAIATVSNGVPSEYAVSDLTAQSAAIAATTLYAVPAGATGMYRISWLADITTADAVSSTLGGTGGFQVLFTSPTDSVVKTTVAQSDWTSTANTTGTAVGGTVVVYAKSSTNIQFTFGYTSNTPGQMIYELHIKVEAL